MRLLLRTVPPGTQGGFRACQALGLMPAAKVSRAPRAAPLGGCPGQHELLQLGGRQRGRLKASAAKVGTSKPDSLESALEAVAGPALAPTLLTLSYIILWYAFNVAFNLQNKVIYNSFPFPWFVSMVHVLVGTIYCGVLYSCGARKASFERPITREELAAILPPATMHAVGHVATNVSFAAVAISFTHTIKTLEPGFNAILSQLVLGQSTPLPAALCLVPIMFGVAAASAAELSFNWMGFLSAMGSNVSFGLRAVWSKKAMDSIEDLGSTGLYAYTSLISLFILAPGVLLFESDVWEAMQAAAAAEGSVEFFWSLLSVGLLYHLFNQFAFNTLERIDPVSHGVCSVAKNAVIIASSVLFFGNDLSPTTTAGTCVALLGTLLYAEVLHASQATASSEAKQEEA